MSAAGTAAFRAVWLGQSLAALGAGLTGFALAVWAYQRTASASQFALIAACSVLPGLVLSPLAGALVDRLALRTALIVGHSGAALSATAIVVLQTTGRLEVWHLYVLTTLTSTLGALQWPAFTAVTTLLVPPAQRGRASGLTQLGESSAQLLAPALGGVGLAALGLQGVALMELAGVVIALATFTAARFPSRPPIAARRGSVLGDVVAGAAHLADRRGLLGLFALSCVLNAAVSFLEVLSAPIVLAAASSAVLGAVRTFAGAGMLAGSLVLSAWGGPRDRVRGVVAFQVVFGGFLVAMGATAAPWLMAVTGFGGLFCIPLINGCSQTLWQTHVDVGFQGRVFALRRTAGLVRPLGYVVAGALADRVLEPWLGDTAAGRGSALLLVMMGAATVAATLIAARYAPLRALERAERAGVP